MRRTSLIVSALLVLGALAGLWWWFNSPLPVEVARPVRGPAVDAIYATGIVEPSVMLPIAPRVSGRLVRMNADEGDSVAKGQVLARLEDEDLASTVLELEARERFARDQFQRTQELVKRQVAATIELSKTRADWEAAQAGLQRARSQRDFMNLVSPATGTIIRRDGEIGQFIPVGQPIFYLSCCAPLRVTAEVDEEDIPRAFAGQKVLLRADSQSGRIFEGEVSAITPKGDPVARSYRVRIHLLDPGPLAVGMTVDANLIVSQRDNALLVPTTALLEGGAVWVVRGGRLHRQPVKSGLAGETRTEILQGIDAGDEVVQLPTDALREGRRARTRAPAAAPASGAR